MWLPLADIPRQNDLVHQPSPFRKYQHPLVVFLQKSVGPHFDPTLLTSQRESIQSVGLLEVQTHKFRSARRKTSNALAGCVHL